MVQSEETCDDFSPTPCAHVWWCSVCVLYVNVAAALQFRASSGILGYHINERREGQKWKGEIVTKTKATIYAQQQQMPSQHEVRYIGRFTST